MHLFCIFCIYILFYVSQKEAQPDHTIQGVLDRTPDAKVSSMLDDAPHCLVQEVSLAHTFEVCALERAQALRFLGRTEGFGNGDA